jgi:hypothetical protein
MNAKLIRLKLNDFNKQIDAILELYSEPRAELSEKENEQVICNLYGMQKEHLLGCLTDAEKKERQNLLSQDERLFWLPALEGATLRLKERKGSANLNRIYDCLCDCQVDLVHYRDQLSD